MGLAGAALLLPTEFVLLSHTPTTGFPGAAWAVAALFGALGVLVGLALALGNTLAEHVTRPQLQPWARALPALLALYPGLSSLFDGAFAGTLPGAHLGFIWAPALGFALVALSLQAGTVFIRRPIARAGLGIALPGLAIELDLFNRSLLPSEYADLHTLLLVTSTVLGGVGLRLLVDSFRPRGWRWPRGPLSRRLTGTLAGVTAFAALALVAGLDDKASRRAIADEGMHGRLLDRAAKVMLDFDRDGHAKVLGGDDCKEFAGDIHPEAREIAGNGIDEDCDGADDDAAAGNTATEVRRRRVERWRKDPEVDAFVRRLGRLNVVLIAVDALRFDPFEPTQENAAAYPNVFALRRRATWFNRAFSTAAGTDLSMTGVMTGRINPLSGAELTLAEGLGAAGYRTRAVVPTEVLRAAGRTLLTRGYTAVDVIDTDADRHGTKTTSAETTTDKALAFIDDWKKSPRGPFFLWAHYFDVHEHYQLPNNAPAVVAYNHGVAPHGRAEKYRTMVSVVDGAIGRLRAGLNARGLGENTAIILLSDHGESLHEDRRLPENHGRFLYNPLIHVPLAIVLPGIEPGELSHPVSLLDVPATFLDLVGASAAAGEMEGESLLPLLLGAPPSLLDPPRLLPLNESDQFGVIAWPHKLMVRPDANLVELYDLSRDFGERNDLAEAQPELVRWLTHAYHSLPGLKLDRTNVARKRWEVKAEATRPEASELQRLSRTLAPSASEQQPWLPGRRPMARDQRAGKRSFVEADTGGVVTLARVSGMSAKGGFADSAADANDANAHAGIVIEPLGPRRKLTAAERRRERRATAAEHRRQRKLALAAAAMPTSKPGTASTAAAKSAPSEVASSAPFPYNLAAVKTARTHKAAKVTSRAGKPPKAAAKALPPATSAAASTIASASPAKPAASKPPGKKKRKALRKPPLARAPREPVR